MIDTIRISIPLDASAIGSLLTNTDGVRTVNSGYCEHRFNVKDVTGLGMLKLTNRAGKWELVVECSAPKLVYGNNVAELSAEDVNTFINLLTQKIALVTGLEIPHKHLVNSPVTRIDYGRNLRLKNTMDVTHTLSTFSNADIPLRRSTSKVKYQNGSSVHVATQKYDITAYDKSAENLAGPAIEEHPWSNHEALLRIEARIRGKRAIKTFTGISTNTVGYLLSRDISTRVVLKAIDILSHTARTTNTSLISRANSPMAFLASAGLSALVNSYGLPATKRLLNREFGRHAWGRNKHRLISEDASDIDSLRRKVENDPYIPP